MRLAAVIFCCLGLFLESGCWNSDPSNVQGDKKRSYRFSANPIGVQFESGNAKENLQPIDEDVKRFEKQLTKLASFGEAIRNADSVRLPDVFADQFETTFIERQKLTSAYLGERIRVARWRVSENTPTYYETIAAERLFKELLEPWVNATSCRLEFKIHTVRNRPNYYDAEVLMTLNGKLPGNNEWQSEIGRSATGVWNVIWQKYEDETPRIKKIEMLGHEETICYLDGGQMFHDCTGSMLRGDDVLLSKFGYGLDSWARKVPGINVIGDNGLAVGDVNNDGLDDVYLCQPHGIENVLLVQNPDGTADNLAIKMGVNLFDESVAALIIDVDNDRYQDLVVATDSRLVLFSNVGGERFQIEHELKIGHATDSLNAIDFDRDGDLDLLLTKYRPVAKFNDIFPQPNAKMNAINGGRNVFLRNDEAWKFSDISSEIGLANNNQSYTRSSAWADYDLDDDFDLYLANEFNQDDLFANEKGWLDEHHRLEMTSNASNTTTVSVGDFNHDGQSDFFVGVDTSFASRRISNDYLEQGGKLLREAEGFAAENRILYQKDRARSLDVFTFRAPLYAAESVYGSVVADLNNDSWEDVVTTNGWLSRGQRDEQVAFYRSIFDPKQDFEMASHRSFQFQHEVSDRCRSGCSFNGFQRNGCLLSIGSLRFSNYSSSSGLDFLDDGRAVGATDWDGDGDVDLLVMNRTAPRFRFMRNDYASRNRYVKFRLQGVESNRDAIGSRIELFIRGAEKPLVKYLMAGSGRLAQSSKEVHFGMGRSTTIEKVVITWPNGKKVTYSNLSPNKTYQLAEDREEAAEIANDRYRIALDKKPVEQKNGLPNSGPITFFPTTRLPILQYRISGRQHDQRWYQIENFENRPLVVILAPIEHDNSRLLRDWQIRGQNFAKMNVDLLFLFTGIDDDRDFELKKCTRLTDENGFDLRWGTLSASSNQKLELAFGQWFFTNRLPDQPIALLMDGEANVHFAYEGSDLNWEVISKDMQNLADQNFVLNEIPQRLQQNWIVRQRVSRFDRLHSRLHELGYVRDAEFFEPLLDAQYALDYMNRAYDLESKGDIAEAVAAAEKGVDLAPESLNARLGFAQISTAHAMEADQQARIRMLRETGKLLDSVIETDPQNEEAILQRAEVFRLQKDVENALNSLIRYLKINPESWKVHAKIGRLYFLKGEHFEATKYLITAIENRPTLPSVAADLGLLYLLNGQYDDSAEFLELAVRLQPSDQNLTRYLAEAQFWRGNFKAAGLLFERTAVSQPTLSHSKQMLAWLKATSPYISFRSGQQGLEIIEPFIELKSELSPIDLEIKSACLAELGRFDQAVELQERVVRIIEDGNSLVRYSEDQKQAVTDRLELYKRNRPYRLSNVAQVPMQPLGEK
ncbi:MAG: FG-GAP-like repeat-containing protein [Planctomycetota bacterium]